MNFVSFIFFKGFVEGRWRGIVPVTVVCGAWMCVVNCQWGGVQICVSGCQVCVARGVMGVWGCVCGSCSFWSFSTWCMLRVCMEFWSLWVWGTDVCKDLRDVCFFVFVFVFLGGVEGVGVRVGVFGGGLGKGFLGMG